MLIIFQSLLDAIEISQALLYSSQFIEIPQLPLKLEKQQRNEVKIQLWNRWHTDNNTKNLPDNKQTALPHVLNLSLSQEMWFSNFKIVKPIPVFKTGCSTESNSCRPNSLLRATSKILEKVMCKRVMSFLTQHKFFSAKENLVLEKKHETNHAITWLVENIAEAIEDNNQC